jgi:hypothetical protein
MTDASRQVEALLELEAELLPSPSDVLQRVLTAADNLQDDAFKAETLSAIAPRLPESEQRAVLERALAAAKNIQNDFSKAQALSAIAPHLPESDPVLLECALTAVDNIQDDASKAYALIAIAPRLSESDPALLGRALTAADKIQNNSFKAQALSAIAPRLPESDPVLLERALTAADKIQNDSDKAQALNAIAPRLPASNQRAVLERALTAAENIQDDSFKAQALSAIAPRLPESDPVLLERALTAADKIQNNSDKAQALSAIAPRLPKSDQRAVVEHALTAADKIQDDRYKAQFLSAIAPRLPESDPVLLERALTAVDNIQDDAYKAEALGATASRLPEFASALLERALIAAENFQDDRYKAQSLIAIAPRLPESDQRAVLERALTAAENIQDDIFGSKALALIAIAPRLPKSDPALLERILTVADNIKDASSKAQALSAIAPHLSESDPALLERALTAMDTLQDDRYKAQALSAIAPRLPESDPVLLERALTAADKIQDDRYKAQALSAIAPRLPASNQRAVLERALTVADNLQDDSDKALALSAIAPRLPKSDQRAVLERALTVADNLQDDSDKALALSAIAPRLPESDPVLLKRALTAADKIRNDRYRAEALSAIAPRLPEYDQRAVLEHALTVADNLQDDSDKALALSAIAPRLPASDQRAVLERALTAADNLQTDYFKAEALSAIAPHLPASEAALLERALTAADNIKNDSYKARALSAIAPQISSENFKRFLEATFSLSDAAKSLASPATRFTKDFLQLYPALKYSTALNIVEYISDDTDKTKFLSAIIPRLLVGLLPDVLRLIQATFIADRYRTETLNNLLPYLPEDQLPEALRLITQSIHNPYNKTITLEELIPISPIEHFNDVLDLLENKIALPHHRASILHAITEVLATPEQTAKLISAASKTASDVPLTDEPNILAYRDLVKRTFKLTQQLKEPQRDDFSYEQAASSIFSQLAPVLKYLAEPEQKAFLEAVKTLSDPGYQATVLIALAPNFKDLVQTALTTYIGDDYRNLLHIKIQLALTDSLSPQDLRSIATQLNTDQNLYIKSPYRKAEAWVDVACHPAGAIYQTKALRVIRELKNNAYLQTQYLQRLIPHLTYQQRLEAANIINDIRNPYHQVSARVALARKFPESEFFGPALNGALALESKVQQLEQLSTLAIDMPELLPRIIKLAEIADAQNTPKTTEEEEGSQESEQQGKTFKKNVDRYSILVALAPHLPMRINREVKRSWALSHTITDDLWDRALYLLARSYRDALTGGTLRNDAAQDKDLLDLKDEINALSGLLLMRDLEPPMTVGILGGWGGGKSYIMHLMQQRMTDVRSGKVDPAIEAWNTNPNHEKLSPYVGHIYQIKFDAWTFAKSDLWASLMQTIFFELNRQISLEHQLARVLAEHPEDPASRAKALCEAGPYWPVLYKASDQDRQWFLERVLSPAQLAKFKDIHNQGQIDDELWRQLGATYQAENQKLTELETELHRKQDELRRKTQAIRSQVDDNQLNQLILKLTGPVSILLSNRISQPVLTLNG